MSIDHWNKTGTIATGLAGERSKPIAPGLGIERVWREVVDFGDPVSGTGEEGWGRKRVSVARVSILDAPGAPGCHGKSASINQEKKQQNQKEKESSGCMK